MTTPAKGQGDFSRVDIFYPTPRYQVYFVIHLGKGKNSVQIFHFHEFVNQDGKVTDVFIADDLGDDYFCAVDDVGGG